MSGSREQRIWLFSLCIALVGMFALVGLRAVEQGFDPPFRFGWVILAVAFAAAERFSVVLESRIQAQALTFSEIPLTFGLIFALPTDLGLARTIGAAAALALVRKLPPVKIVFNVGVFAVEVAIAIFVFNALLGENDPVEPIGWAAAFAAVFVSHVASWLAVTAVLRVAGARQTLRTALNVLFVSALSVLASTAIALGAAATLWRDGRSWVLLVVTAGALGFFYTSYMRIRDRHRALAALHEFTTTIGSVTEKLALVRATLDGIRSLLLGARAILVMPDGDGFRGYELLDGRLSVVELRRLSAVDLMAVEGVLVRPHEELLSPLGVDLTDSNSLAARLPIRGQDGLLIVSGRQNQARAFDNEDMQVLETAAGHVSAAFQSAELVNELREEAAFRAHQALHDDVTDLPNSRGLAETLVRPLSVNTRVAVLTIRIDSLREVNETLGRAMGDEMLQHVAGRLLPLTEDGWCAKTASDEFTVVVRGGNDEAEEMAGRIVEAFEQPVLCDDVALAITAGIGVVLAPDHGRETEILLRRASLAASRSRVEGTRVTVWAADRDPYDPQRLAIAADLRDAIPAGELQVHFQPQVDIDSGLVISAEALVRWRHPRLGELRPDQFISAAEYTGAIDALTQHVLSVAARTCAGWRAQGWDLDVSVNLSARNLANPSFADDVRRILDEVQLDPEALTLELTESSIMTEAEAAMGTLEAIHALGVSISIDDFGTGYSSLAHLRKLPVSEIKIDKSFVFDLTTNQNDEAIVRSMVDLGHHLGLTVVVEGVETPEVRRRLGELGADRIQGYLLSRPMPVHAFEQWIADRPVRMADLSTDEAEAGAASPLDADDRER